MPSFRPSACPRPRRMELTYWEGQNVCPLRMFELTAPGVYVCIVAAGLAALVARRPTSLSVRAAEPRDDQQAHNDGQNAQDAVHSPPGVAAPFCCTRVV